LPTTITQKIELYTQAFHLVRNQIAKDRILDTDGLAQIDEAIRHEINSGIDDVVTIAANACRRLMAGPK
jgi:hypothetical protein